MDHHENISERTILVFDGLTLCLMAEKNISVRF